MGRKSTLRPFLRRSGGRPHGGRRVAAALFCLLAFSGLLRAEQIRIGDAAEKVFRLHGQPTRRIGTDTGILLFYGPLLFSVEEGWVTFISLGESLRPAAVTAPPARVAPPSRRVEPPPPPPVAVVSQPPPPPANWLDQGQERQSRILAERMRRLLVVEVYAAMLAELRDSVYRREAAAGQLMARLAQNARGESGSAPHFRDDAAATEAFLSLRDSQGGRIFRYGEREESARPPAAFARVFSAPAFSLAE